MINRNALLIIIIIAGHMRGARRTGEAGGGRLDSVILRRFFFSNFLFCPS